LTPNSEFVSRYKYAWIVVAIVCVLVGYMLIVRGKKPDAEDTTKASAATVAVSQATIQAVDTLVVAQGTITASQGAGARVAAVSSGRLNAVLVREGDKVVAGQVVAVLDSRLQSAQALSASSALKVSEIQAQQAVLGAKASATDHSNAVEVARLDMEVAQTELRKLENGARPQEIAQAEQNVNQSQATRDRAATELDRVDFLYKKGIDSKRQLDDARVALSVADSALVSAREQASLTKAGARSEDVHTARLRLQSARAALRQAEQGVLQVAAKKRETAAAVESIRQKRADLAAAQTSAGYAQLRTPITGIVTRRFLDPGDMADTNTPVVEITNPHALNLVASVPAEDGADVRPGLPVRIHVENAQGRILHGETISVGEVDPQSGMLSVRIAVPNPSGLLKTGVFASADIVVRTNPRAVVVPKSAVITRGEKPVVFLVGSDDTAHQIAVSTGVVEGDVIEILRGVKPGDRVIVRGQYELSDGAKVKVTN
jgi:HlyD family secretion protein